MEFAGPQEDSLAVDGEGVAIVAHSVVVADLGGDPRVLGDRGWHTRPCDHPPGGHPAGRHLRVRGDAGRGSGLPGTEEGCRERRDRGDGPYFPAPGDQHVRCPISPGEVLTWSDSSEVDRYCCDCADV